MQNNNPISRTSNLVIQDYGNELLVYDLTEDLAMSLNETSARVWQACDGRRSVSDIAIKVGDQGVTLLALSQLRKANLIEWESPELAKFESMPRREAIRRIAMSSLIALPMIASLAAPAAAQAASGCAQATLRPSDCPCTSDSQCASGACIGGGGNPRCQ